MCDVRETFRFVNPAGQWQDERGDRAAEAEASEDLSRGGVPRKDDEARPVPRPQDPRLHQARNLARSGTRCSYLYLSSFILMWILIRYSIRRR
jgi:hypothetical protein